MIAFGVSVAEVEPYRRFAEPGLKRAVEPDSPVYVFASAGTMARTYNLILDAAARNEDLEALVLVHPYTEIADPGFCARVREVLSDDDVGVAGCVGARGVSSIAWWEGAVSSTPLVRHYHEHAGGEMPAFDWARPELPLGEVDAVDAVLMVLSPWAVRNVRFDEALLLGYGYDVDYCLQVREAGRKVVTADLNIVTHQGLKLVGQLGLWVEAHMRFAEKWEGRLPAESRDQRPLQERARRAEAEREAARTLAYFDTLGADARLLALDRALKELESSLSWRLTEPLRRFNLWRRQRA